MHEVKNEGREMCTIRIIEVGWARLFSLRALSGRTGYCECRSAGGLVGGRKTPFSEPSGRRFASSNMLRAGGPAILLKLRLTVALSR